MSADILRQEIASLEAELDRKRTALFAAESKCVHSWEEPYYDPFITEAYTTPGDPPGTMGVDWRGPMYIPRQERPIWKRKCRVCGKVEQTSRTKDIVTSKPVF